MRGQDDVSDVASMLVIELATASSWAVMLLLLLLP